ncbi:Peptidyl-prolyl cis-trans isomerase NIMA-interacting protein 1 [Ordospora colligata]|uniref:Peptidyl-prolyl cis-trans isomerase n=1 Tax=Ordospora colligata OC4 TaxID=1354746 RepID=A0A0B2UEM1_9MICR|nr:PPIase/rotamase [Ordospora colligata OC4]KHN69536.1 PPIase/rotamase [Ordospora colligata OC4]TBU15356.1 PPIase/rotamase [Ordospora colligata]TBU15456.1 PPIase/rotamase [Ordospora colligata]
MWLKLVNKDTNAIYFYNTVTQERSELRPTDGFRLYHILIKHRNSRKPVDTSVEDALLQINKIHQELKCRINDPSFREAFKEYAFKYSQCSSAKRGGDLGIVCGNEMMPEFEKPAFSLKRGEMIGPIPTPSGFHIIYRR